MRVYILSHVNYCDRDILGVYWNPGSARRAGIQYAFARQSADPLDDDYSWSLGEWDTDPERGPWEAETEGQGRLSIKEWDVL